MTIHNNYDQLVSVENLLTCWDEFKKGKRSKSDVMNFERHLEGNIFLLHDELRSLRYRHGPYSTFNIYDPKHRVISKANVRDRLVHHLVFKELYRIFEPTFIHHSYSSRVDKGTHLAVANVSRCLRATSRNYTQTVYALKCDIKKFFWSVPHQKLLAIVKPRISDERFLALTRELINSFPLLAGHNPRERERERESTFFATEAGIPIGNVTSQVFANIYLDQLDQFVKHTLRARHYFRYADDFIFIHEDQQYLEYLLVEVKKFIHTTLLLELHPNKVVIRKFSQGIDFLGYIIIPHYSVVRTKTRQRMIRILQQRKMEFENGTITAESFNQSLQSYLGMLRHCHGHQLEEQIKMFSGVDNQM